MLRNTLLFAFSWIVLQSVSAQNNFQIQIGAYTEPVPDFIPHFEEIGLPHVEEFNDHNGIYRSAIGGFKTRLDAEARLKEVQKLGFPKALIVDLEEQRALCGVPCPFFYGGRIYNDDANEGLTVRTIYFDSGSNNIAPNAQKVLDNMAFLLEHNQDYNLKVLGHTDSEGRASTTFEVAARRARAARNYLISKGISAERLYVKTYGEIKPVVPNKDAKGNFIPENQKLNRRVVLAIIKNENEELAKDDEIQETKPVEVEEAEEK